MFEIFHAIQYNAIVWAYNCGSTRRDSKSLGILGLLFQDRDRTDVPVSGGDCGIRVAELWRPILGQTRGPNYCLGQCLVASTILHFYYDGFIWKVSERSSQMNLNIEPQKFVQRLSHRNAPGCRTNRRDYGCVLL